MSNPVRCNCGNRWHGSRELTAQLQGVAGLIVENKGLTLSIHVRQVAPSEMISVVNTVENVAAQNAEAFRLTYGKKVLEIRPKTNWNKGLALHRMRKQIGFEDRQYFF